MTENDPHAGRPSGPARERERSGQTAARDELVRRRRVASGLHHLPGPLTAAILAGTFGLQQATTAESALLAFLVMLAATSAAGRRASWSRLLPLMGVLARGVFPILGGVVLAVVEGLTHLTGLDLLAITALTAASACAAVIGAAAAAGMMAGDRAVRVVVVGSAHAAEALHRELVEAEVADYRVVGRIRPPHVERGDAGAVPTLGDLDSLGRLAEEHDIELLLMTGDVPRLRVFEEISSSCLHLPMRLQELTGFYEQVFGHVPVGEINAAWFQYIMHPAYRSAVPLAKRVLDVVLATLSLPLVAPLLGLLALIIRRDGDPALFRQERIGEGGRAFTIYKLRTMRSNTQTAWATADDDRITGIGKLLRRTHLDELPQIFNVLRGEMSLVGPRPEQPGFVERLESVVPFYSRRHLIKPGLTGWAQVRCGYAGSDVGSAWKVSHDLYYLKHRSFWMDLVIIGETLRTLVADPQYTVEPATVAFILRDEPIADGLPSGPPLVEATV